MGWVLQFGALPFGEETADGDAVEVFPTKWLIKVDKN